MAPEQFDSPDVDGRADLYALGLIGYVLLTGTHPRSGTCDATLRQSAQSTDPAPPSTLCPDTPPQLDRAVTKLLARDPLGRFQTAADLIAALDKVAMVTRCLACGARVRQRSSCVGCGRPFSRSAYVLEFTQGAAAGQRFISPEGAFEIGRAQLCQRDDRISRRQLAVLSDGGLWIQDAGGVNPTHLNGARIQGTVQVPVSARIAIADNLAVVRRDDCRHP